MTAEVLALLRNMHHFHSHFIGKVSYMAATKPNSTECRELPQVRVPNGLNNKTAFPSIYQICTHYGLMDSYSMCSNP